jgi:hypothetical protein
MFHVKHGAVAATPFTAAPFVGDTVSMLDPTLRGRGDVARDWRDHRSMYITGRGPRGCFT